MISIQQQNVGRFGDKMALYPGMQHPGMQQGTALDGMKAPRSIRMLILLSMLAWLVFLAVGSIVDLLVNL